MNLQLIRNATLRLTYGGHVLLVDPCLGAMHSLPSFGGISENPTVESPLVADEVVDGVELVLVTHPHPDHFDEAAQQVLPKDVPLLCQPGDEGTIREAGFADVGPVEESVDWNGITITRTPGRHGTGEWAEKMGPVCGFVLRADGEPTLYIAGDTIWFEPIAEVLEREKPDVVVTNSGGARFGDDPPIVMDVEQTLALCTAAASARVVAVHIEALDHCPVTRDELRAAARADGLGDRLFVPNDGESLDL